MKTHRLVLGLFPLAVASVLAFGRSSSQDTAFPAVGTTAESSNEIVLSAEDQAVLNTSFIASAILRGDQKSTQGSGAYRAVSFASFVTVDEQWQASLVHGFDTVDAMGTDEVLLGAGYGTKFFEVRVAPRVGLSWARVASIEDLHFTVKSTGPR